MQTSGAQALLLLWRIRDVLPRAWMLALISSFAPAFSLSLQSLSQSRCLAPSFSTLFPLYYPLFQRRGKEQHASSPSTTCAANDSSSSRPTCLLNRHLLVWFRPRNQPSTTTTQYPAAPIGVATHRSWIDRLLPSPWRLPWAGTSPTMSPARQRPPSWSASSSPPAACSSATTQGMHCRFLISRRLGLRGDGSALETMDGNHGKR